MLCRSVLLAAAMAALCLGVGVLEPHRQQPVCPTQHSCSSRGTASGSSHLQCSCDASCRQHGDCCRDSQYYDEAEQTKNANEYECVRVEDVLYDGDSVYMRGKCLETWNNTEVQALCLLGNTQTGDPKLFPVTSTTTATTYVNHYCALCNGEDTASLRMWYARFQCITDVTSTKDFNVGFYEGQWGIIEPSLGLSSFQSCSFNFTIPEDIRNYTKPCLPTVKTCSDPRADQRDQISCQSYTGVVYHGSLSFKNKHCASCNAYKEYSCVPEPLFPTRRPRPVFPMLFDFSDRSGSNAVGFTRECGEVWDIMLKRFVEIFC